jgi:hypothetical protein
MFPAGVDELVETLRRIPKPGGSGEPFPSDIQPVFSWIGQLREYAGTVDEKHSTPAQTLSKLDATVAAHGDAAVKLYEQGREDTRTRLKQIDTKIESADDAAQAKLRMYRRQITSYAQFPLDPAVQGILGGLDR